MKAEEEEEGESGGRCRMRMREQGLKQSKREAQRLSDRRAGQAKQKRTQRRRGRFDESNHTTDRFQFFGTFVAPIWPYLVLL